MPQTSESVRRQSELWRSRWLVTGERTRNPVREQKADLVRTG